nr:hypothetical protein [Dinophyceae sp. MRD-151]
MIIKYLIFRNFEFFNSFKAKKSDCHLGMVAFNFSKFYLKNFQIILEFFVNICKFFLFKRKIQSIFKKYISQSVNIFFCAEYIQTS